MAKPNIHPIQHEITVQMTDGTKFTAKTSWGKAGELLKLDVDPKNHPAWQEGNKAGFINPEAAMVKKFEDKFGKFVF